MKKRSFIRRGEISRIFCKKYVFRVTPFFEEETPFYELLLLDSGAGTRSLVAKVRSFETVKFIEANANRIMGIAVERAGGDD